MYLATFLCFLLAAVVASRPRRRLVLHEGGALRDRGVATCIVIELLQQLATADRQAEPGDVLAEIIGVSGALAFHVWMRRASTT